MKYRVQRQDDYLSPEESLLDSVSPDSKIERPVKSDFFVLIYFLVFAVLVIFLVAGLKLQIFNNEYFSVLASRNKFISIPVSPPRGLIWSKEGKILADNIISHDLWFIPSKIKNKESLLADLTEILAVSSWSLEELINANQNKASFKLKENISKEEKEKLSKLNRPEILIISNYSRIYDEGEVFSHIVGYVNAVTENDLSDDSYYESNDKIGRAGIEKYYEDALRGHKGRILLDRFSDKVDVLQSQSGQDLVLNIDTELQKKIYFELRNVLIASGSRSGVAVALDPRDGRVLALVSLPSYDNNSFVGGLDLSQYRALLESKGKPFFNRVISGRFSPGSTIKPLIALAALKENVISPQKLINAPGLIQLVNPYDPEIVYTFRDWRNHGWVDMRKAIAHSSDIYFYTVGGGFYDVKGLGVERIAKYLKLFNLDSLLGIDLPGETAGFVPTPEWKKEKRGEDWYQGDTFNLSIGQGDLLVTPLGLTGYIGSVANGEKFFRPFIVSKVLDKNGNVIRSVEPKIVGELPFDDEHIKIVKEGMKLAAKEGTAKILNDLPGEVGAKSGTAEVIKGESTNSWISVFAPYDNPQIVLTIMLESGREGSYIPTQIANRVLQEYFKGFPQEHKP